MIREAPGQGPGSLHPLQRRATVGSSIVRASLAGALGRHGYFAPCEEWSRSLRLRTIRAIEADITRVTMALELELMTTSVTPVAARMWLEARDNLESALHCLVLIDRGVRQSLDLRTLDLTACGSPLARVRGVESEQLLSALSENPDAWWHPLIGDR